MDNPFLQSVFVQPCKVMGRELRPFSAYHATALMMLDSPFMMGGERTLDDLMIAVYVCSYGFTDGPAKLFPYPDLQKIKEWGGCPCDFETELNMFQDHIDDYLRFPEMWEASRSKHSGIPWPVYIVATILQGMGGITEAEAWDMPLGRAVCYKTAMAEQAGGEVVSDKQKAMADILNAEDEAK